MGITDKYNVFIVNIDFDFSVIQVIDTEIGKLEVEWFLPNWIVGLFSNLHNAKYTAVFLFSPII